MNTRFIVLIIVILSLVSCGCSDDLKAKRISVPKLEITTSKKIFDPESDKIICDSLSFKEILTGNNIQKLIVINGQEFIDTLDLKAKKLVKGIEGEIIFADMDFDGNCEFIIPDKSLTKSGGIKHYYFMLDPETRKYFENKTLPSYISSFKLDIKNQRVKLYCPNGECFAYYKYNPDKKFSLVQGNFKLVE